MSTAEHKLRITDLHPTLQTIFEIGCEVECALANVIRKDDIQRTALNLTDGKEKDYGKVDHYENHYETIGHHDRLLSRIPVYAEEHRWRVHFAVEKAGKLESGLSFALDNVKTESQGLKQLGVIAKDLQRAYDLSYTPRLFRNNRLVQ